MRKILFLIWLVSGTLLFLACAIHGFQVLISPTTPMAYLVSYGAGIVLTGILVCSRFVWSTAGKLQSLQRAGIVLVGLVASILIGSSLFSFVGTDEMTTIHTQALQLMVVGIFTAILVFSPVQVSLALAEYRRRMVGD
jgi:hypothetical protein